MVKVLFSLSLHPQPSSCMEVGWGEGSAVETQEVSDLGNKGTFHLVSKLEVTLFLLKSLRLYNPSLCNGTRHRDGGAIYVNREPEVAVCRAYLEKAISWQMELMTNFN